MIVRQVHSLCSGWDRVNYDVLMWIRAGWILSTMPGYRINTEIAPLAISTIITRILLRIHGVYTDLGLDRWDNVRKLGALGCKPRGEDHQPKLCLPVIPFIYAMDSVRQDSQRVPQAADFGSALF